MRKGDRDTGGEQEITARPALGLAFLLQLAILAGYGWFVANTDLLHELRGSPDFQVYLHRALGTPAVLRDIAWFAASLALLLWLKAALAALAAMPLARAMGSARRRALALVLTTCFLELILLGLNSRFYPASLFGWFRHGLPASPMVLAPASALFLAAALGGLWQTWSTGHRRGLGVVLPLLLVVLAGGFFWPRPPDLTHRSWPGEPPNVLILGIDALRPDTLGVNGFEPSITPELDRVLEGFRRYTRAVTPMGRTHAAWVSVLSGKYPKENGLRFNLTSPAQFDKRLALVETLRARGYRTLYAMDERRFNNIDESYGFERAIGPRIGVADILLSGISDQPVVNLFSSNGWARYLFPFVYLNRGQYKTYRPELFADAVLRTACADPHRPTLLAVHLTLPHFPFVNRGSTDLPAHLDKLDRSNPYYYLYLTMVHMADQQFGRIYEGLSRCGFLDDAVVVLLSDHGESFFRDRDALHSAIPQARFQTEAAGHGTSITSPTQIQVLLAVQRFSKGRPTLPAGTDSHLVSLVDVAPTVETLALHETGDGCSLVHPCAHPVFTETSISPDGISGSRMNVLRAVMESLSVYTVSKDGRVIVKPQAYDALVAAKKRAALHGRWGLAHFPDMRDDMILFDLGSRRWWPLSHYQGDAPVPKLVNALCDFYEDDPGFDPLHQCQRFRSWAAHQAQDTGLVPRAQLHDGSLDPAASPG